MALHLHAGLLTGLALSACVLDAAPTDHRTTAEDLIRMRKGGLQEDTILDFLRTYRATVVLEGRDAADLTAAGFSDGFVQALLAYTRTQPPAQERPAPRREEAPPAEAPVTTYYVGYAYDAWAFPPWYYGPLYWTFYGYYGPRYYGPHSYGPRYWGHGWGHRGWHGGGSWHSGRGFGGHRR